MRRAPHTWPRSLRTFLLFGAGLAATLSLSQCRMVEDNITGPKSEILASSSERSRNCFDRCKRTYARRLADEIVRHRRELRMCRADRKCISAENARYGAALLALAEEKRQCLANCHHQGGGTGGR